MRRTSANPIAYYLANSRKRNVEGLDGAGASKAIPFSPARVFHRGVRPAVDTRTVILTV
jgi:hypothetical protein